MRSLRFLAFAALLLTLVSAGTAHAQTVDWIRQLGTSADEINYGVSVDGMGNVFISGTTTGDLGGTNAGGKDAFVSKYDTNGNLDWTKQLGTSANDYSFGVSADSMGNVFISGRTQGNLEGESNSGASDAFVSKYDTNGNLDWTRQLGTSFFDESLGVSADGMGNVYISGRTQGDLGGTHAGGGLDAFVSKYDANGNSIWTRQIGSSSIDISNSIFADGMGNVFISGYTDGDLDGTNAGSWDAFVSKFDANGNLIWTRQMGTSSWDESYGVSADSDGNVFISGLPMAA